jgi:hypothetical protein
MFARLVSLGTGLLELSGQALDDPGDRDTGRFQGFRISPRLRDYQSRDMLPGFEWFLLNV